MIAFRARGVTGDSPEVAALWDLGCLGVIEEDGGVLAFFATERELPLAGTWEEVEDRDHVAEYHATLDPVEVPPLVIAASHHKVLLQDGQSAIWLDPGMAFGTGHHETTKLALQALTRSDLRGARVLDVGAGTGILAIAADLLGARSVYGVDIDPVTVEIARVNAAKNRSRARFALGSVDLPTLPGKFDVVVANLYAELHAQLLGPLAARLLPGGRLYLTGILRSLHQVVLGALPGELEIVGEYEDGEWLLLELTKLTRGE